LNQSKDLFSNVFVLNENNDKCCLIGDVKNIDI
jgi:hypothetical protein